MDTDMMDAGYDIEIDVGPRIESVAQPPQQVVEQNTTADRGIPAAYLEDLGDQKAWPESLNLQGVNKFDPTDPTYYAMEHCGANPRVKQLRWVSDSSVNLEFYSAEDAAAALHILTHPEVANPNSLAPQEGRRAKPFSKQPEIVLTIRESNSGDQKPRGAANRSNYYKHNPDVAGNRQSQPRRRQPHKQDVLDYGEDYNGRRDRARRRGSEDELMNDDSGVDRRRPRRNGRDTRDARDDRGRGGRLGRESDAGRLKSDVDSYRPGSASPHESRFGRLRGRSASPGSGEEGDGRYGFAEEHSHADRRRYRSRSRSRNNRRRREASGDRWTHDRANHDLTTGTPGGRWQKDSSFVDSSPMGNHRRSDAMDVTGVRGGGSSLLSRMTKDGQPLTGKPKRSLADRITRDDEDGSDSSYGRLKGDNRDPWVTEFPEPARSRGLADRMTRNDDYNSRERDVEGINIRGMATNNETTTSTEGFNIRGMANSTY